MKKILLSLLLLAASGSSVKTFGQITTNCRGGASSCNLTPQDVRIQVVSKTCNIGGNLNKTQVVFSVNFKIAANSGNKDIYFHSWKVGDYPPTIPGSYFQCGGTGTENAPKAGAPGNLGTAIDDSLMSFLDIGINNVADLGVGVIQPLVLKTVYAPDITVVLNSPLNSPGMTANKVLLANGLDSITITNARVIIHTGCLTSVVVKTLVWASNATDANKAQCWASDIRQGFDDPLISGHKNCTNPRTYVLNISTVDPTLTTLKYTIWIDKDNSGGVSAGDIKAVDTVYVNNFSSAFNGGIGYAIGPVTYPGGNTGNSEFPLIVQATTGLISNFVEGSLTFTATCAPLPVTFKSFTAARNHSVVGLNWVTVSEQNNTGFAIERLVGAGGWQQIAFVPSQAAGGNSSADLTYSFSDNNSTSAVSQYRLKQIDFDNRSTRSDIRAVRGEGQVGKTIVYPNPSNNGKVTVVFEDVTTTRDISLMDMSGRMIKQIKAVTNNNIQFENLTPGVYSLRVVNRETGDQVVEKIVVNNR